MRNVYFVLMWIEYWSKQFKLKLGQIKVLSWRCVNIWVLKMLMLGWFWRLVLKQKMRPNIQFFHDVFFPPWSVSMGPWYPFSYMIAMNIDLYGQLSDWFILWIIIHAYEADRSCVNTMILDMSSKDCWYKHLIVYKNN